MAAFNAGDGDIKHDVACVYGAVGQVIGLSGNERGLEEVIRGNLVICAVISQM